MQAARDAAGVLFRSLRKQKNKFIAAVTKGEINQSAVVLDHGADFAEEFRAHQVAMGIVDGLEVIEVNEDEREFVAVAVGAVDLRVQHEIQMPRVVKRG